MEEIIDMQMPVLLCAILLIVISIPLYFGKGSNMIAGYNDLSQVDKEKINWLRLCRMLAITLDITAIILIFLSLILLIFFIAINSLIFGNNITQNSS